MFLLRDIRHAVERRASQDRNNDVNLVVVDARAVLSARAGHRVEVCELTQTRHSASDSAFQLLQLIGLGAGGKKIDVH
jgi:hypothetical protein